MEYHFKGEIKIMTKKEIKNYLKRVAALEAKLTGEDEETYAWLIYGYNECAKLLNETEQQCKKQKELIDRILNETKETRNILNDNRDDNILSKSCLLSYLEIVEDLLKEVQE